jgi:hypothetical protein
MCARGWLVWTAILVASAAPARARAEPDTAPSAASKGPIRVDLNCEGDARTKACPAFIAGFIDAHSKVLLNAPRAAADVSLYVTATQIALLDHLQLRFVSHMPDAPAVIELSADLDSRADDDTQRAQLAPAFLQGVGLYVAARFPGLVTTALGVPDAATAAAAPETSPWDVGLSLGGYGSVTAQYQSLNTTNSLYVQRLDETSRIIPSFSANTGLNRQPPLTLTDGTIVSTNTTSWNLNAAITGAWLYDDHWSFGGHTNWYRDDRYGQYRYTVNAKAAAEWDLYKADDPRGNRLAVLYYAGYQADGYNLRDDLGETAANYPIHGLISSGSVRKDKASFGLELTIAGEVIHPGRRHQLTAAPFVDLKIGGHIDLTASFSITKRELPPPDPAAIDPTNYAEISRLSYAEPLALAGSLYITIHGDRTNGARNDRFSDL